MRSCLVLGALLISFGTLLHAQDGSSQALLDGVAVSVDGEQVELRVASPHAFLLHVATDPKAKRPPSIYLSGAKQPVTPFTQINEGGSVGLKTDFGSILVDPANKKWSLRDARGRTLSDWATLGTIFPPTPDIPGVPARPATDTEPAKRAVPPKPGLPETIHPEAGPSEAAKTSFYGPGNTPRRGSLTQDHSDAATGNGRAGLPQYWSTAGYGALMIGPSDNAPAFWKTVARGSVTWVVPGTGYDLYLMPAASLYDWLRDQAELTGFAPVPPQWVFGYMQSRWGWESKDYIDQTLAHFRQDQLPVDTFILDFEWYTATPDYEVKRDGDPTFVDFGWNANLLPDPAKQIADFKSQGLHIVGIRKPRIGNAENLAMARSKGWILPINPLDPNGVEIRSRNLDFSNPDVRAWWEENNRKFLEAGMAGFWNDEGETNYVEYSYWNTAEIDLQKQVNASARWWSINRSFIPGMQRFGAAVWTGDIHGEWGTLAGTPGELLSFGLSGMPYSTCDIGGYAGKNETPEMLTRWMEAGVFFPIMRSHSAITMVPHFPWLSGQKAQDAIRKALDLRYRLIPYYYSLAHETYKTGAPVMRPLVMEFPDDEKMTNLADEWLMGKGLLAAPILTQGGARSVYLPTDNWFVFGTTQALQGPQTLNVTSKLDETPVYVRAGTIPPLGPVVQYTGQATKVPLEVEVYPGRDATFRFVQDDGSTIDYQKGVTHTVTFTWSDGAKTLKWAGTGTYHGANLFHGVKVVLFSPQGQASKEGSLDQDGLVSF